MQDETAPQENAPPPEAPGKAPWAVYALYLLSPLIALLGLAGAVVAYLSRGKGAEWVESHYTFQIRTFWIFVAAFATAVVLNLLLVPGVGVAFMLVVYLWLLIRSIYGMSQLHRRAPIPDPEAWLFGWQRRG